MNRVIKAVVLGLLVPCAMPASAQQQTETQRLAYRAGESAAVTMRRIDAAALEVCGASAFSLREVEDAVRATPCWRDAVADARKQLVGADDASEQGQ